MEIYERQHLIDQMRSATTPEQIAAALDVADSWIRNYGVEDPILWAAYEQLVRRQRGLDKT